MIQPETTTHQETYSVSTISYIVNVIRSTVTLNPLSSDALPNNYLPPSILILVAILLNIAMDLDSSLHKRYNDNGRLIIYVAICIMITIITCFIFQFFICYVFSSTGSLILNVRHSASQFAIVVSGLPFVFVMNILDSKISPKFALFYKTVMLFLMVYYFYVNFNQYFQKENNLIYMAFIIFMSSIMYKCCFIH